MRFLKNGIRIVKRDQLFSLVNILGLSLGMFCFLITSLYVRDELTHDKWHANSDRIYVSYRSTETTNGYSYSDAPFALHDALLNESPGVEAIVNIAPVMTEKFSFIKAYEIADQEFSSLKIVAAEPSFFKVFDFGLKLGNEEKALTDPKNAVISSQLAERHFGGENPIGEFITLKGKGVYSISGVLNPIPSNSHLLFDVIVMADMNAGIYKSYKGDWQLSWGKDYVLRRENYALENLEHDLDEIYDRNTSDDEERVTDFSLFSDLYMQGRAGSRGNLFGGDKKYVYIFSIVGVLLFLVACFNYVNLKIASSFARTKDMAVRKVLGASKRKLIFLSIGETALVSFIALILSLIAVEMSLPSLNQILGKRLDLSFVDQPQLLVLPILALVLVILISGIYPALISSSFNLSSLLKGSLPNVSKPLLRKIIVGFQFTICAGLLSSALIIRGQANYLIGKDLGYNTESVYNIDLYQNGFGTQYEQLKMELERIPQIIDITGSSLPGSMMSMMLPLNEDEEESQALFRISPVDHNFHEVLGIDLLMGQTFSNLPESRLKNAVLINETAYKAIGQEDVIGMKISRFEIIGVVNDFHVSSVKSKIAPVMLMSDMLGIRNLQFKFRAGEKETVMAQLEQMWKDLGKGKPLQTSELATHYANAFKTEETLVKIFNGLTMMIVAIAFFGLFTISTFENKFRERELGIRKVLGASYLTLLKLSNVRFLSLVGIALLISIPITYHVISDWLEGFPYRVENVNTYFIISSIAVLIMTVLVLTIHGHKNAQKNPVDILRNE